VRTSEEKKFFRDWFLRFPSSMGGICVFCCKRKEHCGYLSSIPHPGQDLGSISWFE